MHRVSLFFPERSGVIRGPGFPDTQNSLIMLILTPSYILNLNLILNPLSAYFDHCNNLLISVLVSPFPPSIISQGVPNAILLQWNCDHVLPTSEILQWLTMPGSQVLPLPGFHLPLQSGHYKNTCGPSAGQAECFKSSNCFVFPSVPSI